MANSIIIVAVNTLTDQVITNTDEVLSIIDYYDEEIIECQKEVATSCMFVDDKHFYMLELKDFTEKSH